MDQSACKLTLVFPESIGDRIVEVLQSSDPPIAGFTTWAAEGHGHDFDSAGTKERVRGRVKRQLLVAVMTLPRAEALLEEIRQSIPVRHLTYWIEPVLGFGTLTPTAIGVQDSGATKPRIPVEPRIKESAR